MNSENEQLLLDLVSRLRNLPNAEKPIAELAACLLDGVLEILESQVACCFSLGHDLDGCALIEELFYVTQQEPEFYAGVNISRAEANSELGEIVSRRLLPVLSATWLACRIRPSSLGLTEFHPFDVNEPLLCFPLVLYGQPIGMLVLGAASSFSEAEFADVVRQLQPVFDAAADYIRMASAVLPLPKPAELDAQDVWNELELLKSSVDCAVIELDENCRISSFNHVAASVLRASIDVLCGTPVVDILPRRSFLELRDQLLESNNEMLPLNQVYRPNVMLHRRDDSAFIANVTLYQTLQQGKPLLRLVLSDITITGDGKEAQAEAFRRFRAVSDLAPVGIFQTTLHWSCTYVNERWCEITGLTAQQAMGMGWVQSLDAEKSAEILKGLRRSFVAGEEYCAEVPLQDASGERVWVELNVRPLVNEVGVSDGFLGTYTDVTFRKDVEQRLKVLTEKDSLTGLANREVFQSRLNVLANHGRHQASLVLLYIGVDALRLVNDSMGHENGDKVLSQVAARLRENVRASDLVARFGGDEFTVLLDSISDSTSASRIAENLRSCMAEPFLIGESEVFISVSVGVAMALPNRDDVGKLLSQANMAFRRAKENGKNTVEFYTASLITQEMEYLHLGNSLHRALERDEMRLYFQPQVDVKTGEVVGLEALLRWQHPKQGIVPPIEFISLLEQTGLINPVGDWVIEEACLQFIKLRECGALPNSATMSVNISPRQLRRRYFVERVEQILNTTGMPSESLVIEITESVLFDDASGAGIVLNRLKRMGLKIALDDFGTGYSSLTYLKQFPIDILKIDKSFVIDMLLSPADTAITKGVIALAKSLDIVVVAEGVENEETLEFLRAQNCDHYQGYYFEAPKPVDKLTFCTEGDVPDSLATV